MAAILFSASSLAFGYGETIWTSQDIGTPAITGSTVLTGSGATGTGVYAVYGSGTFGGITDTGQIYWQPLAGDGTLVARLTGIATIPKSGATAGVIIRNSLSADSPNLFTQVNGNGDVSASLRTVIGGATKCVWMVPLPSTKRTPSIAAPAVVPLKNWGVLPAARFVTSSPSATETAALPFTYQISAANFPASYNATGLPAGLNVNTASGVISGAATASGTATVALSTINASGTGTETLTLTMSPTAYNTWQNQHFSAVQILNPNVSGDTATPAGDGINNLLKFALNLNPWTDGVAGLPQPGTVTVGGTNYLSLTYTQVIGATDITYIPEVSVDLKTWNSGTGCTSVVSTTNNLGGLTQTVTVQGLIPLGGAPREFMRLEITGP